MNDKEKILLVEDEDNLAIGLEFNLNEEGYEAVRAKDGKEALELFEENKFDLIILDIMLPYFDGFEIAAIVRHKYPQMPILMLTARTAAVDRIKGLEVGADDYLTKPFHLEELLLRVKGMLKRKSWYRELLDGNKTYKFGSNQINFETLECSHAGESFRLTPHEAMVMRYFIDNRAKIVTRKELLEKVWHLNPEVETRTVDIFVARLRKYFEEEASAPKYLISIRSMGYKFEEE
ncbi:MAG: response regulator transcription factor [Ignavibacteriaceae bacterium]|nr:response regulator transcription factor [Ignavibacteriaceae bacterium]